MDDRTREGAPDRRRWDLTALFEDGDAWSEACDRYERRVDDCSFDDALAGPEALAATLETRDGLLESGSRLKVYAEARSWIDGTDDEARRRVRRIDRLNARRDAALEELETALREAGRERVDRLRENGGDRLEPYDHYLDDAFRRGEYSLDPAVESALADLTESLDAPARTLRTVAERSFDPPTVTGPDGEAVRLTKVERFEALTHPDRAYRRRASEAYRGALRADREVTAQAYVDHLRRHVAEADLRGYESALSASLDGLFPGSLRETLVEGIRRHRDPFLRRYELLGDRVDGRLRPFDFRAPLSDADAPEIPYGEAVDLVVDSVEPLGDRYRDRLAALLDDRRVDVYPGEDKRGVSAAMFGEDGAEPLVFLNYAGTLESLYLFAHELGHVMHYDLARRAQPPAYRRLAWEVGELPSFLAETLLTDHLLDSDRVPDGAVLDVALRRSTPLPAARGAAFTHRLVEDVRADREPTADDVDDHFLETGRAYFDPVSFDGEDGYRWQNLNLDRDPFHAYYYLIGRTTALAAAHRFRTGDLTTETYLEFLRAGESEYPAPLLESLSLEFGAGVVEEAGAEYGRLVDGMEAAG